MMMVIFLIMMMIQSGQWGGNVAIILIGPHITIFATTINVTSFLCLPLLCIQKGKETVEGTLKQR